MIEVSDVLIENPPNTGDPVHTVWMFVSRDAEGKENVCGANCGTLGFTPLITGNPRILHLMLPTARFLREQTKESGKTLHLLTFSNRQEHPEW